MSTTIGVCVRGVELDVTFAQHWDETDKSDTFHVVEDVKLSGDGVSIYELLSNDVCFEIEDELAESVGCNHG